MEKSRVLKIKSRKDFVKLSNEGQKFISCGIVLQLMKRIDGNKYQDAIRVGFTTTKKLGNAVCRNRIRRRLREVARRLLPVLGEAGYDYVFIGRKAAFDREFSKLVADGRYVLQAKNKPTDGENLVADK